MSRSRFERSDLLLLVVGLLSGFVFFTSLDRLWPLADTELNAEPAAIVREARAFLLEQGMEVGEHAAASRLEVDSRTLDYLLRAFGRARTQELIRGGSPIYVYEAQFKRYGDPDIVSVMVHPEKGVLGWIRTVQEDAPGAVLEPDAARMSSAAALAARLGLTLSDFEERGAFDRLRPARRDHVFVYERLVSEEPELREKVTMTMAGDQLTGFQRQLVAPESERRAARRREAPVTALQIVGIILVGIAGLGALVVFLTRLQRGEIRLRRAVWWVAIVSTFFLVTQALRTADLFARWDPLWPRWIATLQSLGFTLGQGAWVGFALFVFIAAGDALDREKGGHRGATLWRAGAGRFLDPAVGLASIRGFLVGLICGGALVASVLAMQAFANAEVGLQPQGFFFFAINSELPALATLLYFLMVALGEELGYRFFAGSWLETITGNRLVAIVAPAALYGLTHTGLDFLPPYEPFWGRALAFTVVGCIWGWAFFRYDALTVVLSHFTADLFIFNWPRLGSGDPRLVAVALVTIAVPLVPGLFLLRRSRNS